MQSLGEMGKDSVLSGIDGKVTSDGRDLFLMIKGSGERITVSDWFAGGRSLSSIRFSDGTVWSAEDVESRVDRRILGTDGDDVLEGLPWDDVIVGGKGNDVLRGEAGRDTYEWSPGDGNDIIEERGTGNVLKFGAGAEAKDVHLRRSEDDLHSTSELLRTL